MAQLHSGLDRVFQMGLSKVEQSGIITFCDVDLVLLFETFHDSTPFSFLVVDFKICIYLFGITTTRSSCTVAHPIVVPYIFPTHIQNFTFLSVKFQPTAQSCLDLVKVLFHLKHQPPLSVQCYLHPCKCPENALIQVIDKKNLNGTEFRTCHFNTFL